MAHRMPKLYSIDPVMVPPLTSVMNIIDDVLAMIDDADTSSKQTFPSLDGDDESDNRLLRCVLNDLQRLQQEGNQEQISEAWNSLGLIRLHTQHNAEAAIRCHRQALQFCQDPVEIAVTLNDLGYCFERLQQPDRALVIYKQAQQIIQEHAPDSHPRKVSIERSLARILRF